MKKLILVIACFFSVTAWGQLITSAKAFKSLTEDQFYAVFGSVAAYNMEAGLEYNSSHHRLVMLIGARLWWLQELPKYMAEQLGCSNHIDSDNDPIHSHFQVVKSITSGDEDNTPVDIICSYTDDSLRIVNVKITGNTELLVKLFIYYWEHSEIHFDVNKFKKGCLFYENCGSDRICFNWKGVKPNITIKKNPTFVIPLPTIAERN